MKYCFNTLKKVQFNTLQTPFKLNIGQYLNDYKTDFWVSYCLVPSCPEYSDPTVSRNFFINYLPNCTSYRGALALKNKWFKLSQLGLELGIS